MSKPPLRVAAVQRPPVPGSVHRRWTKRSAIVEEPAAAGASAHRFPGTAGFPAIPGGHGLDSPPGACQFVARHSANCMTADGPEAKRIAAAAAESTQSPL